MPNHVRAYQRGQRELVAKHLLAQIEEGMSLTAAAQALVDNPIPAVSSGAQRRSSMSPSVRTLRRWFYEFYPPGWRKKRGLELRAEGKTQREVAQALGVSIRTVRNWERG